MQTIYLDYNATTPIREEVLAVMARVARESFGNPSSAHGSGRGARRILEECRERVAKTIGASGDEIIFTSGGSESDNLAIRGVAANRAGGHIVTCSIEHPAVYKVCEALGRSGYDISVVGTVEGRVDVAAIESAIRPDTILVTIMWANNEAGQLQPIDAIARVARERGVLFHTDAVQAFGKVPVDVRRTPVDLLALSGHKFYAPKGVGILYRRRGVELDPQIVGGNQEHGVRAGTENIVGVAAIAEAAEHAVGDVADAPRVAGLRDSLETEILARIPDTRCAGSQRHRLPNTTNIAFRGVSAFALITALDEQGIAVSGASACHSGTGEPSGALMRGMGLSREEAIGAVRFSLGHDSSLAEIERVIDVLPGTVDKLRAEKI